MSLNNISLPPSLLADLYTTALVEGPAMGSTKKTPVPFLGKNEKNILVLVHQPGIAFLPEKELTFLTSVLSACQLDLSDVCMVNWAAVEEKSFAVLHEQLAPKKILLLNVNPEELGFSTGALYAVQRHNEIEFVAAPALVEIEKTKQAKSNLWLALKQLFCL